MTAHERLGLTPRQTEVYALRYWGHTQVEVAAMLGLSQARISQHESAAKRRNPALPALTDGRRHRTAPLSTYPDLAKAIGLN